MLGPVLVLHLRRVSKLLLHVPAVASVLLVAPGDLKFTTARSCEPNNLNPGPCKVPLLRVVWSSLVLLKLLLSSAGWSLLYLKQPIGRGLGGRLNDSSYSWQYLSRAKIEARLHLIGVYLVDLKRGSYLLTLGPRHLLIPSPQY